MTEIALALSMWFFCIMILSMVSMGVSPGTGDPQAASFDSAALAPSNPGDAADRSDAGQPAIIIYYRDAYFSPDMSPVRPESLGAAGEVILAVAPDLSMAEALKARAPFTASRPTLSLLSPAWLARLAQTTP